MQEFFKAGITNGNDWYPVFNGLQDWLYVARGARALTLELWNSKWPSKELLPVCMLHTSWTFYSQYEFHT